MLKQFLPVLFSLLFFSVTNAQSNNAAFYYKSGIKLKNDNKFAEAIAAFDKAVSLNKKFDSAYVEIADIYNKSGKLDLSISNYKKAISLNPSYTAALTGIGQIYRDAKQNFDSALFYYGAAAKIDSTKKEIFYALAWTYNAMKNYDNAIPYAIKALEIDNNYRPAYGELGYAYRAGKKFSEGIIQFKKNLAVSVMDVAMLYLGFCYTEVNNKEAAMQQYEELKKINEKMAVTLKKKIDSMQ